MLAPVSPKPAASLSSASLAVIPWQTDMGCKKQNVVRKRGRAFQGSGPKAHDLQQEQEARMRCRTAICRKDIGEFNGICCRADDSRHLGLPLRSAHVNF